ncbi:MAG: co-chaperone DjlA [Gammaproteobacteria bacterium]|nr:co-chaperone DjlA [Gammaproteobacteria bacterium]
MSWWGKVIGGAFGFMLGGPLGAVLGAAFGHQFDKGLKGLDTERLSPGDTERVQLAFFTATFSVMGHMAKADGQVTRDEIALAEAVMARMDLAPQMRKAAIKLFDQGKKDDFPLDDVLDQFRQETQRRRNLLRMFLEIQLQAALADGTLHAAERRVLERVCDRLGLARAELDALEAMFRAEFHHQRTRPTQRPVLADAYAILGVDEKASDAEIKRAYRRLMSQHHPDKLVAKGLPEEMMKVATQKTHEIRQAYEAVREARGF